MNSRISSRRRWRKYLTGARKYRLGLILAQPGIASVGAGPGSVASAVLSNPYTRVVFRVGDADTRALESGFSFFEARDLQNLETGQAICRVEKADNDFNLSISFPETVDPAAADATRQVVIAASRAKYATPCAVKWEAALLAKLTGEGAEPEPEPAKVRPAALAVTKSYGCSESNGFGKGEVRRACRGKASHASQYRINPIRKAETSARGGGTRHRRASAHNLIRERIETLARSLGYSVAREKQTPNGGEDRYCAGESPASSLPVKHPY